MKSILKFGLSVILVAMSSIAYSQVNKDIRYLESPTVYEGKTSSSFKVSKVFNEGALAHEISDKYLKSYHGKMVFILGDLFYDEQIVNVKSPMLVGIYKYGSKTVPVLKGTTTTEQNDEDSQPTNDIDKAQIENKLRNVFGQGGNETIGQTRANNSWSLEGRSIRGTMPLPSYGIQEEGTIVVRITVNENGDVIIAEIAPGTDITSKKLHNAAIAAAKKTRFNAIPGKKNQAGTITYKFELR